MIGSSIRTAGSSPIFGTISSTRIVPSTKPAKKTTPK
jgi:hypothetical protein